MSKQILFLLMLSAAILAQDGGPAASAPQSPGSRSSAASPTAALPRVRTGVVSKAEFTTEKPSAESSSPVSRDTSSAWAILSITLDPGRAASVFDYVLRKEGTEYRCLDLAEGDGSFPGKLRIYSSPESKVCRMVFAVPSADDEYELIFKLASEDETPVKLNGKTSSPSGPAEGNRPDEKAAGAAPAK